MAILNDYTDIVRAHPGESVRNRAIAGETIVPGRAVYLSNAEQLMLASNRSRREAQMVGIAMSNAFRDQPCIYVSSGWIMFADQWIGTSMAQSGAEIVLANTYGGITDPLNTEYPSGAWPCSVGLVTQNPHAVRGPGYPLSADAIVGWPQAYWVSNPFEPPVWHWHLMLVLNIRTGSEPQT